MKLTQPLCAKDCWSLALHMILAVVCVLSTPDGALAQTSPTFGLPLSGLTKQQLADFNAGQQQFSAVETVSSGLGPIFNNTSCIACHSLPVGGGSSAIMATRFGRLSKGVFNPLASLGGSLLQEKAINPIGLEHIPTQSNVTAKRQTPPLFGLGLIEAIPDATILAGVRSTPVNGVLGRASMVKNTVTGVLQLGRFGWKAQNPNLLDFAGNALVNEIGITNRIYKTENAPNGNTALLAQLDTVPDPEDKPDPVTGKARIDRLADFTRLLAPPPPLPPNVSTVVGAKFFLQVGCTNCHVPRMTTGANQIAALNNVPVPLYSDLLLHNMGPLSDGISQGDASPTEMKTTPLWGLRASGPYLHDGRAATVDAAIRAHDGEAATSRDQYLILTTDQQNLLLEFLGSI